MVLKTYIDKFNTIIKDSDLNVGINEVAELVYGSSLTRLLLHFNVDKLKSLVCDKTLPDMSKMTHTLKIPNCGSIDFSREFNIVTSSIDDSAKLRASSFDLIFFLIPKDWDGGKGYDYAENYFNRGYHAKNCSTLFVESEKLISRDGANWYQPRNGYKWDEEGIYSNDRLSEEYDKFSSDYGSDIIIARQRFNIGNEDISVDITEIVNKYITGELDNYGIGIAYSPLLELDDSKMEHYCGFLTHKNHTFLVPYVETRYDDYICDDRSNFVLDKNNRLYLYCNIGEKCENLDEMPTCSVNGIDYEVKQFSKGIYYIDINLSSHEYQPMTMLYDTWSNIKYNGTELDDVELDFVVHGPKMFFNIGNSIQVSDKLVPTIYGIECDEKILRGDIRKVVIQPRVQYKRNVAQLVDDIEYRIYVKDGEREITVIPFENANKAFTENYFLLDTSMLHPQRYHVDVKMKYNMEMIIHHDVMSFEIIHNLNNKYA